MNILLISPEYPDSFWSFKHALRFVSKKAAVPPLGLITVSAMLPKEWHKKLIDMNIHKLQEKDITWADYVFISAMYIQKKSVDEVIALCLKNKTAIVAGGPLFTQEYVNYPQINHFILNEAEITLPPFLNAIQSGKTPERIYQTNEYADLSHTPVPDYHLLSVKDYAFMSIQVSRGCPFNCDFCEITSLLGHKVRIQPAPKVIETLETLYQLNWRGPVSVVDDNFIGNKKEVKYHLLPAMKKWMQEHNYPFSFNIQSSINLADDDEMLTLMTETGFNSTFIGIETPDEDTLQACNKHQNEHRNLLESVKKIQQAGFNVSGGFIVGFDSDNETVFQRQADFIQKSGIVSAMVGLLNAPKNTQLYHRLKKENRLTVEATGNNTDSSMNFVPKMNFNDLISGYKSLIRNLYESRPFYQRTRQFMMNYRKNRVKNNNISIAQLRAVVRLILIIGILNKGRTEFWKFLFWTLFRRPALLVDALTFTAYGHHFRIIYGLDK